MTGFERIRAALEGRWPDRRPVLLHNFRSAAREAGLTMRQFRESPAKAARAFIDATERYGLDGVLIDFDTATLAGALGVGLDFPEDEPALAVRPRILRLEAVRDLPPPDLAADPRIAVWVETCRLVKAHFGPAVFVRGNCDQAPFSLAGMMRSPADWLMDLVEGGEGPFRLLDYCADACLAFLRLVAASGVDMLSNGDSPAGPSMISPAMYRTFALPYERALAAASHELGLPYLLHICGDASLILPDMASTGADALELDSLTPTRAARDACGDRLTLFGNIDPAGVLRNGPPERVADAVDGLLDVFRDSPRLVVNAGCALTPDTPPAHIRRLIERARNAALRGV